MNRFLIVRSFAFFAAGCIFAVPVDAQNTVPLDIPEVTRLLDAVAINPRLVSADLRIRGAEARIKAARSLGHPVSAFFDAEEIDVAEPASANLIAGLERAYTPKAERNAEVAIATAELVAARARRDGVRLQLESTMTRIFLEAVVYSRMAHRLAEEDSLLQSAQATLHSRFSVGQARYIDVIRLRTERLRVQADLLDVRMQISRSLARLRTLSTREVKGKELSNVVLRLPKASIDPDSLIARSPVMRAARAEQERARAALHSASARGATRFAARLGIQRFQTDRNVPTFGPTLGGSVSLPFTNRGSVRSGIEAARLDTAAAAAQGQATIAALRTEVAAALARIDALARRIAGVDQQLINTAREERQTALTAYATGELTLVELLDFERSLSRSEIQLLKSYDAAIAAWHSANQLLAGVGATTGDSE